MVACAIMPGDVDGRRAIQNLERAGRLETHVMNGWAPDMRTKVFLDYDQAELDRQYDQRVWAPNAIEVINRYTADSEAVRGRLGEPETHPYGEGRAATL